MKNLYILLNFIFVFAISTQSQAQQIQWYWAAELSPTSRMGNTHVLRSTENRLNLEWRNRFGMEIGEQLFIGLQGHYRKYDYKEFYRQEYTGPIFGHADFSYDISNNLWGTGPFITKFIELNRKINLHATVFASVEQGKGNYKVVQENFNCANCETIDNFIIIPYPLERENIKFREKNFYSGMELGMTYRLSPKLSALASLNLIQFESFNRTHVSGDKQEQPDPEIDRPVLKKGNGFSHFAKRPIAYLGVLVKLR